MSKNSKSYRHYILYCGYAILRFFYRLGKNLANLGYPKTYSFLSLTPPNLEINIIDKSYSLNKKFLPYSTVTPVLNEEKTIVEMLKSIEAQTLNPDQVIIVDGGSSDLTVAKINEYKLCSKLDIIILHSDVQNIAVQRNIAIEHSRNDLLLNVDAGTSLDKNYAANMMGPFWEYADVDLVGGVHYPKKEYLWSPYFSPAQHFITRIEPYGACVAYKKNIALKIGKYPEYLTYAGEDTFFIYKYKKIAKKMVLNRSASILWEHPTTLKAALKKRLSYIRANFEIGLWPYFYHLDIFNHISNFIIKLAPFNKIYNKLLTRQAEIEIKNRHIKGLCFIFSNHRIENTVSSQYKELAIKMIDTNYKVFFINFDSSFPQNVTPIFINTDHSLLELLCYKVFHLDNFKERYGDFMKNSIFIIGHKDQKIIQEIQNLQRSVPQISIEYL